VTHGASTTSAPASRPMDSTSTWPYSWLLRPPYRSYVSRTRIREATLRGVEQGFVQVVSEGAHGSVQQDYGPIDYVMQACNCFIRAHLCFLWEIAQHVGAQHAGLTAR